MTMQTTVLLQGQPPDWAVGEQPTFFWYFVNEYGEQWIARLMDDELMFAGSDVDWQEVRLTRVSAQAILNAGTAAPLAAGLAWLAVQGPLLCRGP